MAKERAFLPYGRQLIEDDDIDAVSEVLRSDYLTTGPVVDGFEEDLAACTAAEHAISVSSGTAALHLAGLALGLKPGDVAIVPAITFLASANIALYAGAEVHFADVDPETGLMTAATLARAMAEAGAAARMVVPVHVNGHTVDMAALTAVLGAADLMIVEDACHALGGYHFGPGNAMVPVGSNAYADLTIFSFHPVKTVAMGEGGAITTNDAELAGRLRVLRNIGMTRDPASFEFRDQAFDAEGNPNPWYYEMAALGFNYRASALHCALGRSQLKKLGRFAQRRTELMVQYRQRLLPLAPRVRPLTVATGCDPAWHLCVVQIDFAACGKSRAEVMRALQARGVGTQVHYIPLHRQPYFHKRYGEISLPGAEAYYERALSLPLFASMTEDDVDYVVASLTDVLGLGA
jgi:UDP-4-amino-4,6-dideoxy-N-acetyl-beta-L-altrosamine transaminase